MSLHLEYLFGERKCWAFLRQKPQVKFEHSVYRCLLLHSEVTFRKLVANKNTYFSNFLISKNGYCFTRVQGFCSSILIQILTHYFHILQSITKSYMKWNKYRYVIECIIRGSDFCSRMGLAHFLVGFHAAVLSILRCSDGVSIVDCCVKQNIHKNRWRNMV